MTKQSFVYMMTNYHNSTIYIGVTNNLVRRVYEHKNKMVEDFTAKYNLVKLVYYEIFEDITLAIQREKQLKGGSRKHKEELINFMNPGWKDLYDEISKL